MSQQQRPQPTVDSGDVFPVSSRDDVAQAQREDLLGHHDIAPDCLSVTETHLPGKRLITSATRGQVVAQFAVPEPVAGQAATGGSTVTIGEALEAAAEMAGDKPVNHSDAAAVQAAEVRATGLGGTVPGGVAAAVQEAADLNARVVGDEERVKLSQVLGDATERLPADKAVTREDAEKIRGAEKRNNSEEDKGQGVGATVETASRMNQQGGLTRLH